MAMTPDEALIDPTGAVKVAILQQALRDQSDEIIRLQFVQMDKLQTRIREAVERIDIVLKQVAKDATNPAAMYLIGFLNGHRDHLAKE